MKLVPYDRKKLPKSRLYRNMDLIKGFMESKNDCVKIEDYSHCSVASCQASFCKAIKNLGLEHTVRCVSRKGEVYLIKID